MRPSSSHTLPARQTSDPKIGCLQSRHAQLDSKCKDQLHELLEVSKGEVFDGVVTAGKLSVHKNGPNVLIYEAHDVCIYGECSSKGASNGKAVRYPSLNQEA
jgi:hypothetical protein